MEGWVPGYSDSIISKTASDIVRLGIVIVNIGEFKHIHGGIGNAKEWYVSILSSKMELGAQRQCGTGSAEHGR